MEDYKIYDKSNMLGFLDSIHKNFEEAMNLGKGIQISGIKRILVCGMGGSGIPGDILKSFVKEHIPIEIIKDYKIPEYHDSETLAFIVSYSGNTEETLSCYRKTRFLKCQNVLITSDGKLTEIQKISLDPIIMLPKNMQPRAAIPYFFFAMLNILIENKIVKDYSKEYKELIKSLEQSKAKDIGLQLAEKLLYKIPLIYSSNQMKPIAYRWKTQFNENSKLFAFNSTISELNHNELEAFPNARGEFFIIILTEDDDDPKILRRIKITKELLKKHNIPYTQINITGHSRLVKLFTGVLIGDYASLFLAIKEGRDPTPVKVIEDFKKKL